MEEKQLEPKGCPTCKYQKCSILNVPCSNCNVLFGFSKEYYPNDIDRYERREG